MVYWFRGISNWTKVMAYWCRIGQSKFKVLSTQFRRCYIQLPSASLLNSTTHRKPRVRERPYWVFQNRPTDFCSNARFFAAPVQAKTKKEERDNSEPRINEEITAQFVRLVMDDGHSIVSRLKALERARGLKLDLVEVQKNAKPPVCKIMDYHKEKYKQQEREKERAKSKSELSLRKGVGKEMRFSAKAELKDLKMKADMVKKLMEKGYRVKCRALGTGDQDLEGLLSRFSALIEDVSVVESGPHLGKKEAYVIVRHVKFGLPKKGGGSGKKLQDAALMSVKAQEASDSDEEDQNESSAEGFETEEEVLSDGDRHTSLFMGRATSADNLTNAVPKAAFLSKSDSEPPAMIENRYRRNNQPSITEEQPPPTENRYKRNNSPYITQESPAVTENRYKRTNSLSKNNFPSMAQQPPVVTENRYKRTEPRTGFQQTTSWDNSVLNNRGPEIRDSFKSTPSDLNQNKQASPDTNIKTEVVKQAVTSGSRNPMPSFEDIRKGGISHPSAPNGPRSGYGIFSATKGLDTPDAAAGMHRNREAFSHDSAQHFSTSSLANLTRVE